MWKDNAASTSGFCKTPAAIISFPPLKISSAGSNTIFTLPSNSSSCSFNIRAAVNSIAELRSCPQVCASVPVGQANGSPLRSSIGNASMSAFKRMTFPFVFLPTIATTPCPHSCGSIPYSLNFSMMYFFVLGNSSPTSAF